MCAGGPSSCRSQPGCHGECGQGQEGPSGLVVSRPEGKPRVGRCRVTTGSHVPDASSYGEPRPGPCERGQERFTPNLKRRVGRYAGAGDASGSGNAAAPVAAALHRSRPLPRSRLCGMSGCLGRASAGEYAGMNPRGWWVAQNKVREQSFR